MQVNLTFNKPAANMFFAEGKGLKIKIQDNQLLFKSVDKESGTDVFPVQSRTRGGVGVTVSGRMAERLIKDGGFDRGMHFTLDQTGYKWVAASLHDGPTEKPSKIVPTARLWRVRDEVSSKSADAPARAPRASRASQGKTVSAKRTRRNKSTEAQAAAA